MQYTLIVPTSTPLSHIPFFLIIIITTLTSFPCLHSIQLCPPFSCNPHHHDTIQFPFHVPQNQSSRCGYPGFDLTCTQGKDYHTLLTLPSAPNSPYIVRGIDYTDQLIFLSDKNQCLPQHVLKNTKNNKNLTSNLRNSPYTWGPDVNSYSFLNCTFSKPPSELPRNTANVSCMGGSNFTVLAALGSVAEGELVRGGECHVIERVVMSLWWPDIEFGFYPPVDLSDVFLQLSWDVPQCGDCVLRGGSCGFVSDDDQGLGVGCFISSAASGLPKSAKYGLILGVGIPGLVCMLGLTLYISGRARARNQNRRLANLEASPSIFPQPAIITLGLDRPTIESYPKTILGESKRLPKPSDGTCPICLSEYQPKETLRSIPECNHYFHADCIDEWLRLNGTCPLCRNSPPKALPGS